MLPPFVAESAAILRRSPATLAALLRGLPDAWTTATEGPGTWSAFGVLGHLVHTERTDWMVRLAVILDHGPSRPFDPLDREAQFHQNSGRTLNSLLDEFAALRRGNLERLADLGLTEDHLALEGMHPALGLVTAHQLIAAWVGHDLTHIVQIARTMAKRYQAETGPWVEYLSVMSDRRV